MDVRALATFSSAMRAARRQSPFSLCATSFAAVVRAEDADRMLASVTASTGMPALDAREVFARARRAQYRARLGSLMPSR
jgi:hypothetical protein